MRWRSLLFVPGNRPDLAAKAVRCRPDAVVLDLEDAVPAEQKEEARAAVREAAEVVGPTVLVRVNPPGTEWFEGDVTGLPARVAAVIVPKYERPLDIGRPVFAGLETVRGVLDARSILDGTIGCYFGAEDYVVDLGGIRTAANDEVGTARALVGMAACLAGVPALDMVTLDFGASERFEREAAEARALGYAGKLCIHPTQVGLANAAFVPSATEVERARRLLKAFDDGGGATFAFEGQMVDEVVARHARTLLVGAP